MKTIYSIFQIHLHKILLMILLISTTNTYSCINCNKNLQHAVIKSYYDQTFLIFSAFIVLTVLLVFFTFCVLKYRNIVNYDSTQASAVPIICTALILGIGLGGFADGIVFHQILQWHGMLSHPIPLNSVINKSVNMFWDGIFHLFTFLTVILGVYLLWKIQHYMNIITKGSLLLGGLLAGWGIFNLIEGLINHHILKLHNVREISSHSEWWNVGFLSFGLLLIITGSLLILKEIKKA